MAETDFTRKPVTILVANPATTVGKKRIDVWIGDKNWASWKLFFPVRIYVQRPNGRKTHKRDAKYPKELNAAHVKNTARQMQVKATFFQSELGIIAGFPLRSCHPIQKTKAGSSTSPMLKSMMFGASLSLDVLAVMSLNTVSECQA